MRRHALFIGLLIVLAAARFTILLASQTHVHSDEAIIGLMGQTHSGKALFSLLHVRSVLQRRRGLGSLPGRDCVRIFRRQRRFVEELRCGALVTLPFSILLDVSGAL